MQRARPIWTISPDSVLGVARNGVSRSRIIPEPCLSFGTLFALCVITCNASTLLWINIYVACPQIFLLFAITMFHTDQQLLWSLILFFLVRTLVLMTKKNKNILSNIFFSLIKNWIFLSSGYQSWKIEFFLLFYSQIRHHLLMQRLHKFGKYLFFTEKSWSRIEKDSFCEGRFGRVRNFPSKHHQRRTRARPFFGYELH